MSNERPKTKKTMYKISKQYFYNMPKTLKLLSKKSKNSKKKFNIMMNKNKSLKNCLLLLLDLI